MAYAVVVTKSPEMLRTLRAFLEARGIAVRLFLDVGFSCQWLSENRVDLLIAGAGVSPEESEQLMSCLCRNNPFASLLYYDPASELRKREKRELLLMGAEVLDGETAEKALEVAVLHMGNTEITGNEKYGVLVVDDLETAQFVIGELIRGLGYPSVATCVSVEAAMQELRAHPFRYYCIVTDLKMPKQDGLGLIRQVRADERLRRIPIVVLTAYGSGEALLDCLKAGATHFMLKPPKAADLKKEIARCIRMVMHGKDPRTVDPGDSSQIEHLRRILEEKGLF